MVPSPLTSKYFGTLLVGNFVPRFSQEEEYVHSKLAPRMGTSMILSEMRVAANDMMALCVCVCVREGPFTCLETGFCSHVMEM